MGICISRRLSTASNNIRVVHLNGYVEEFEHPVTASQVTGNGKPPRYFICTASQLLSNSSATPVKPDYFLQPGSIYFLLPFSALQSEASLVDFAAMTKRLTAKAKSVKTPTISPLPTKYRSISTMSISTLPTNLRSVSPMPIGRPVAWSRSWQPNLDTIGEKSFTRSESDLHEMRL